MGVKIDCSNGQERSFTPTIAHRKQMLRDAVRAKALGVAAGGVAVNGAVFASDAEARQELLEAALAAAVAHIDGEAFTADIELLDGGTARLTRAECRALAKAFRAHTAAVRANARSLIQAVNAASTQAALDAIDINTGWPT